MNRKYQSVEFARADNLCRLCVLSVRMRPRDCRHNDADSVDRKEWQRECT